MAGEELTGNKSISIEAGEYIISYYSASSGTGKLQHAPDGTNFHDVANTSLSASGDIEIAIGALSTSKWKAVVTGDMKMYLMPINQGNV